MNPSHPVSFFDHCLSDVHCSVYYGTRGGARRRASAQAATAAGPVRRR